MGKMESDCQVTIKGLPEPVAQNTGKAVSMVISALAQVGDVLDLRRMHRVVVTTDFAGELAELRRLSIAELKQRWRDLIGTDPPE